MPLQNRVTPFGEIISTPERGMFTGNRGIIHDPETKTLLNRRWTSPAWIICRCAYKGRRREVMGRRSWTELFFLDEATALAAGHRPCFECRRAEAEAFRAAFARGRGGPEPRATEMDRVLHEERLDGRSKRLHPLSDSVADLPDGAMIAAGGEAFLVLRGQTLRWSPGGYGPGGSEGAARLLTPPSTLAALRAGYRPVLHASVLGRA
jgi:hypothetical protein